MIDLRNADDRAAAAGEYVLGTLTAEDHAAVQAAIEDDAALRTDVYAWQDRLLGLSGQAPSAEPAASLWQRIERSLELRSPARAAITRSTRRPRWWQGLRLWQGVSAVALAASFVLGTRLLLQTPDGTGARYVAVLQSPANQATGWVVEMQAGRELRLVPVGNRDAVPAGRALQFWTKAEGAAAPTSLGLVRADRTVVVPLSMLPAVEARQLFEITLEPETGSPTGRPTGPILFVGRTVAL